VGGFVFSGLGCGIHRLPGRSSKGALLLARDPRWTSPWFGPVSCSVRSPRPDDTRVLSVSDDPPKRAPYLPPMIPSRPLESKPQNGICPGRVFAAGPSGPRRLARGPSIRPAHAGRPRTRATQPTFLPSGSSHGFPTTLDLGTYLFPKRSPRRRMPRYDL